VSSASPQEAAAAEAARTNFDVQGQLSNIALPGLKATLDSLYQQLGTGNSLNQDVHNTFETARTQLGESYDQGLRSNQGLLQQQARQSGEIFQPQQVQDAISLQATQMDHQRVQGMRNLRFQESQAGLSQYNQLMTMLGQGSGAAFNMGQGFSSLQSGAIGGMNNQDPWGGALAGAGAGASLGGSIGGGYGAAIGAIGGGFAGYYGAKGG